MLSLHSPYLSHIILIFNSSSALDYSPSAFEQIIRYLSIVIYIEIYGLCINVVDSHLGAYSSLRYIV